jgi:hypothetical protein
MRWWIRFSRIGTPAASRKPSGESGGGGGAAATTTAITDARRSGEVAGSLPLLSVVRTTF